MRKLLTICIALAALFAILLSASAQFNGCKAWFCAPATIYSGSQPIDPQAAEWFADGRQRVTSKR
jgi:hypothetical protein